MRHERDSQAGAVLDCVRAIAPSLERIAPFHGIVDPAYGDALDVPRWMDKARLYRSGEISIYFRTAASTSTGCFRAPTT